jgi:hypothetical protein
VRVERVRDVDDALVADVARLLPQLSTGRHPPTREQLDELIR